MSFWKAIALILILAILVAGAYYLLLTERTDNERMQNLYAEVEPLERERASLIEERDQLQADYALKFRDYATTEILFTSLDAQIFTDVYPVMRDHDVVGVLGFSYQEMPIYYNKLTVDQCLQLIGDGWGTCIIFDQGWGSFTSWYENLSRTLTAYKLPVPTSIYFASDNYYTEETRDALNEEMIACGIQTVILNAADGRTNTVTDVTGDLWTTGAMPFNYTGSATDTELLGRTDGANLCFTMKFNEVWDLSNPVNKGKNEIAEAKAFSSVLASWDEMLYDENPLDELESVGPTPSIYIDPNDKDLVHDTMQQMYLNELTPAQLLLLPRFRSTTFENALQYHRDSITNNGHMQAEMDQRRAELDTQISDLDARISEIYARLGTTQSGRRIGGES